LAAELAHEMGNALGAICACAGPLALAARSTHEALQPWLTGTEAALPTDQKQAMLHSLQRMRELAEIIEHGAQHAAQLAVSMKHMARPEPGRSSQFDPEQTLRACLRLLSHQWKPRIEVITRFEGVGRIPGSAAKMQQVFMNLLINACQAIPRQGQITLATTRAGNSVRISIQDTGGGIPAKVQHRIFEPYFTTKGASKGTGLGLAIARDIVSSLGGSLGFTSQPGKGTEFFMSLPAEAPLECETTPARV